MVSRIRLLLAVCLVLGFTAPLLAADPASVDYFETKVRPLLATQCFECHGPTKQESEIRLDSRAA